jgi:hypothetical protein
MKRIYILYFLLLFPLMYWAQPPQGKKETNVQMNAGYYNIQTNQSSENALLNGVPQSEQNTLLKSDSAYFQLEKREREDVFKQEESLSMDQQTKVMSSFSLVRQKSKLSNFQRTPLLSEQQEMDAKVKQLELLSPNSWEYQLAFFSAGNYNLERAPAMEQAFELNQENTEVQKQYFSLKFISGDTVSAENTLSLMSVNDVISLEVERYTNDVLTSCTMNSTLITHGFEDTYGALFNQFSHQIRSDVKVISLDFLQSPQFRKELEGQGYVLPKYTKIDIAYLSQFCFLNAEKDLFLSVTIPRNYLEPLSKKLFPVGLTFQYAERPTDDLPIRQENLWFYQLNKYGLNDGEEHSKFAMNYMPLLMYLEKKYIEEGNEVLLLQIRESMDQILGKKPIKKVGN